MTRKKDTGWAWRPHIPEPISVFPAMLDDPPGILRKAASDVWIVRPFSGPHKG